MNTTLHTYPLRVQRYDGTGPRLSDLLGFYLLYRIILVRNLETLTVKTPWALALGSGLLSAGLACLVRSTL